ncbi:hypothetical protein JCM8547_002039 [Rhodosporidiobolus lusitaniae]
MSAESSVHSSSDSESSPSTSPSTPPLSPKLGSKQVLPSPFYPPTLANLDGDVAAYEAAPLPAEFPPLPSTSRPRETDAQTKGTPDEWIIRDEALVRLTGKWPFNVEPSLPDLWQHGFLTPTRLFYVRNHGVVPQVTREEGASWTFTIEGLCERPCTLSLADLIDPFKFQTVTLPVTLVCAGNRRKEQNIVSPSLGFSWGAAGLSTALFTGVYLADVLDYVRPKSEGVPGQPGFRRPEHVIFEGAEDLPKGKYGTSQRLRWARQKEKGMLLAWAMNGEALEPDHGFPLRLVVPGQIGGRSVKWLKRIEISDKESQHHLHFWDNKVLPGTLTAEQARAEPEWWYDPRYIINDLNVNSAIARPAHDEQLVVENEDATYTIQGYVYAGGGRRVTRMEVTLDDGVTWTLAELIYPEDQYRTVPFEGRVWGKMDTFDRDECFCWAFWRLDVPVSKLIDSPVIAVRGMDESLHLQGPKLYWNPTGMMNNWWFRVVVHRSTNSAGQDVLRFEHPTMPGTQPGGWMQRLKDDGLNPAMPSFVKRSEEDELIIAQAKEAAAAKKKKMVMTKPGITRNITKAELEAHNTEAEPWFVCRVDGKPEVYDGTGFLKEHPGGPDSITLVAGEDATEDFFALHSDAAKIRLAEFHIGTLVEEEEPTIAGTAPAVPAAPDAIFLDKRKWKGAKLVSIDYVNHDSRLYRFALDHEEQPLGLPVGQHVYARLRRKVCPGDAEKSGAAVVEGELVQRAYTPVSKGGAKGYLDLLIKVYFKTADFPEGGKMTLGFEELQVGDIVEFKGPLGSFEWIGAGACRWRGVERKVKHVAMICAGSGITPILQVLRGVIHDPNDTDTKLYCVNANKTEADILMRAELEELERQVGSQRFKHHLVLSRHTDDWKYGRGRINKAVLQVHFPPPSEDTMVLFCGPDPLIEALKPGLQELGYDLATQLVIF